MRRFGGRSAKLLAGMNNALAPFSSHGRRLRAERRFERIFEMSPALLAIAGFDGYLGGSTRHSECSAIHARNCCRGRD